MKTFIALWFGQLVSLLGSTMTAFALPIWIFGETGRVQELALLNLAFMLPGILISPFAGVIVDRYNRKWLMILTDGVAGLATIVLLLLASTGRLAIWHLYFTTAINGVFQTFQWPAYSSVISVMLPKEQYGRAAGMQSLAQSAAETSAPLLAAVLLMFIGLPGILLLDILTFVIAIIILLWLRIPQPLPSAESSRAAGNLWREAVYGFRYVWRRPGLLGLQLLFTICNFFTSLAFTGLAAMILWRTNQNTAVWSWVSAAGGIGGLAGGLIMSAWGGPRRRIHGVLIGWAVAGSCGLLFMGLGRDWPVWMVGIFAFMFAVPFLNGANQAIWQTVVAPDVQGRVFAIRRMIAWLAYPFAKLLVIPLTDGWLEPAMRPGGSLALSFGWLVGVGPGAGMGLVFVFAGIMVTILSLGAYRVPQVRLVEELKQ